MPKTSTRLASRLAWHLAKGSV